MAKEPLNANEVVLAEEAGHVSILTLNRPRQLNVISSRVVELVAKYLEKWERDVDIKLVIIKGAGRAFSAGGDLKMFYEGRSGDFCLEVVYRMYWLCYHIHTYTKSMVAIVHGIVMGGGAAMTVPLKFSVVTEKTVFSMPEASIGLHTDCSFSYILPHLPGYLGEYLGLTDAKLCGKDMVALGLATHFVQSEKLDELEKRLLSLNSGDENSVRNVIEEFSMEVLPEEATIINRLQTINKCFCKESLEEIIESFEAEAWYDGNDWIWPVLKGFKRSSPTGLKITLRSIREGRTETLPKSLKKEFRLTMNLLRSVVSDDVYEGIRALSIDKDKAPKWNPATLEEVSNDKVDLAFKPFSAELELQIPAEGRTCRWEGKYEHSVYPSMKGNK
ncbi:3-hydroxyisobutyryl-CoA hydrolase-like protein 5 [Platanthera zijinensis]|uniref:3-hydroxyisobutyryl-CoA hydrolase n=1 Tax=Platanthera zijinensis TaxID=2320716 RepID=A0AAP0BR99_9ASPA